MYRNRFLTAGLAFCAAFAIPFTALPAAHADAAGDTMRTLAGKYKGAVVTLSVVVAMSNGSGSSQNAEVEVSGVVVDPSGLVVVSNTSIDPTEYYKRLMGNEMKMTSSVSSARILVADGDDIPAKVVLRDSDLNLAFLRPVTPLKTPLPFVDMKTAGKSQIGDNAFLLSRMGTLGNRQVQVNNIRVVGVLDRPRTLYMLDTLALQSPGSVAFGEDGSLIGLVTLRLGLATGGRLSSTSSSMLPIVVPAEEIAQEAAQAPQSAVASKAPEAPAKPAAASTKGSGKAATTAPKKPAK